MLRPLWLLSVLMIFGFSAGAATPYKRTLAVKKNEYMRDGVFTGGVAGKGSSLLGVRRQYSAKRQIERVVLDIGDHEAKAGKQGYFQVALDSSANRLVVDFAQLKSSRISEPQLRQMFKQSPFVKDVALTMDPEDQAGTLVLDLKRPVRLEVFQMRGKGKAPRVVLDMMPAGKG
ncbi:MAG TPA: hypothetical protein PKC28_12385 [Bdellovibrionales bacterium]|nr:hypothetical protein [Bdellovibrionales bacterium]